MHMSYRLPLASLMIALTLLLSGCESSEDKAERYYQSGLTLVAAGDEDLALLEFRNVFKYNGFHKEARQTYADILLRRGDVGGAYSQYLRLIEQYPDTVAVRQTLAEVAVTRGDWDEVTRHGEAAVKLAPDDPRSQALKLALEYRAAVLAKDEPARSRLAEAARTLLEAQPDRSVARRVLIDWLMSQPDQQAALPEIDAALVQEPKSLEFHITKFRLLAKAEDVAGSGAQLKTMFELFPENIEVKTALIGWYLVQKDIDGAEAFLREVAGAATGDPEGHLAVIQLLQAARGRDAARAELDRLIAANTGEEPAAKANAELYTALRATSDFDAGQTAEAITAMEELLKTADASDQTRRLKGMLARMLEASGNRVGARALVEAVLVEDPTNVDALKLRANWLIAEDKPGEAIIDLRAALSQAPRDADVLTLMAAAHERDGNLDLAGERLALAVEVSGSGAVESLRYAAFLQRQGRDQVVESVLTDARRANPVDASVLGALGEFYLRQSNWEQVQEVVEALRALPAPEAQQAAQGLQAALLTGQNRTEDSLSFLESQIDSGAGGRNTVVLIVQTKVRSGKTEEARAYLDDALLKAPDDANLRILSASLDALMGRVAPAEAQYRDLIAKNPQAEVPVRLLYGLLTSAGRTEDAAAVLAAGLTAIPRSSNLRWMRAGEAERSGDVDGAIAVYEELYAEDSSNVIVANNLASLITTHRTDAASLERAFAIARRLRGSDIPAFLDTYGWIEYRRGNLPEALASVEPAAKGLPGDALVQLHLGMIYAGLNRTEDAIRQFDLALDLAGDSTLPAFEEARSLRAKLATPASP